MALHVVGGLSLKRRHQHPPRSAPHDLVQLKQLLAGFPCNPILHYLQHRWRLLPPGSHRGSRGLRGRVRRLFHSRIKSTTFGNNSTRLSCHRFRANEVRLWLSIIAYNLGNLWRRLALPKPIGKWSLTSLQQRLVKTGGRLIRHARYYWLLLAESHLTRRLFAGMLAKIAMLQSPAG